MILFDFEYESPETLEAAVACLEDGAGHARLLAGGTDILPNMRVENIKPERLVSLAAIAPRQPEVLADGSLRIDALMRLSAIVRDGLIDTRAPLVAAAAHTVAGNQIRQMGTLGGNLCQETRCLHLNQKHDYQFVEPCNKRGGGRCYPFPSNADDECWSVYMSDIAPGLVALDAALDVLGPEGKRRVRAEDLFSGDGMKPLNLAVDELIAAVIVPEAPASRGWGYHKAAVRGGLEFGMAILAAVLDLEADGKTCRTARIVVGAVEQGPVRPLESERILAGRVLDRTTLGEVAARVATEISPLPHHGFTKSHLRRAIRVHLEMVLGEAADRARRDRTGP